MTQEEKSLLLKDLCARLPYGVKLDNGLKLRSIDVLTKIVSCSGSDRKIDCVKPYLRPLSSMTKEEFDTINARSCLMPVDNNVRIVNYGQLDFLNSHHFDYRGLIEKGLALEAPEDMYKIKQ